MGHYMNYMKILALSDMHGILWHPSRYGFAQKHFDADIAIIAGDVVPATMAYHAASAIGLKNQVRWVIEEFIPWTQTLPVSQVLVTWGNHDWFADQAGDPLVPAHLWPSNVHILQNERLTIDGIHFYGVPQTPRFYDWAFNEDDTEDGLGARWRAVPDGTDVLISHGPPLGACDRVFQGGRFLHVGSVTQRRWLDSGAPNVPRHVVCGHIHSAHGERTLGDIHIHNVSMVNERYHFTHHPVIFSVAPRTA